MAHFDLFNDLYDAADLSWKLRKIIEQYRHNMLCSITANKSRSYYVIDLCDTWLVSCVAFVDKCFACRHMHMLYRHRIHQDRQLRAVVTCVSVCA